jgi:prevent-host-death family protein
LLVAVASATKDVTMDRTGAAHEVYQDRLYTMRQLNQHTADVLREINERGEVALVTRRGRFVAAIVPLAGRDIEGQLISGVLSEVERKGQLTGERSLDRVATTGEVVERLGVNLPGYVEVDE